MSEVLPRPTSNVHYVSEVAPANINSKSAKKRIMLVIPAMLFRNGIESVLQGHDRVIVGDCASLDEVEAVLDALPAQDASPDLFVVSLAPTCRDQATFARIRALRAKMPASRWIMLCSSADIGFLRGTIESGVEALLLENSPREALQLAADLVLYGLSFISVDLAKTLALPAPGAASDAMAATGWLPRATGMDLTDRTSAAAPNPARQWQVTLSDRESEILQGLVAGHSNKLIARDLRIAEATVKVHVKALLRKMQVTNRTQAAISALQFLHNAEEPAPSRALAQPAMSCCDAALLAADARLAVADPAMRCPAAG